MDIVINHEGSIQRPIPPWANALTTQLHLAPPVNDDRYQLYPVIGQHGKSQVLLTKILNSTCKKKKKTLFDIIGWLLSLTYVEGQHDYLSELFY